MATKKCPYCGEEIQDTAKKCRYCGEWLESEPSATPGVPFPGEPIEQPAGQENPVQYEEAGPETVSFFQAYFKEPYLEHYADFKGVTGRKQFWLTYVASMLVSMGVCGVAFIIASFCGMAGIIVLSVILGLFSLALLVPTLALTVRRLRDAGKNPWLILLALIPGVGGIIVLIFMILPSQYEYPPRKVKFGVVDIAIAVGSVVAYIAGIILFVTLGVSSITGSHAVDSDDYSYDNDEYGAMEEVAVAAEPYSDMDSAAEYPDTYGYYDESEYGYPSMSGNYTGNIGKYRIRLNLQFTDSGNVSGRYQYSTSGDQWLTLVGQFDGSVLTMDEYNDKGDETGHFQCSAYSDEVEGFSGEYTNYQGKRFDVEFTK